MSVTQLRHYLTRLASATVLAVLLVLLICEPPLQATAPDPSAPLRRAPRSTLFRPLTGLEMDNPLRPLLLQRLTERFRPPVLLAQASDAGTQLGQSLLPGMQRPTQGQVDQVPNFSQDALNQGMGNKYYKQQPTGKNDADPLGTDATASNDATLNMVQGWATNPNAWYFSQSSDLLKSLRIRAPANQDVAPNSCANFQYCTQPGPVQEPHDCDITRNYEEQACHQYYEEVTGCRPLDQSGTRAHCVDHYIYVKMVTDPATGNIQLLSLDTGPEGAWHKNCGGSGDVGGWWLLDTFPPTQDVPTVTFDTSGAGCATIHTQLSTLDQQIVIAICPTAGAQVPNIQWSAHADNCSTWSEYRDDCTAYEQAPWFEIRHQCLSVVPGDLNDCGDMQRTYGKITDLGNTCTDWINQGCVLTSNRCASNNSPCTDEALTYACTADGCQQWGQALLCSACIPNPPGPPKCKDTTTPINNEFGLATAMMEGMVTLGHDLRNENDVRAFPGFLQVCKSNLLVNCCDTAAAQKMAQNVNTAINAVQMTMQALQIANLAIDFAGYMSSAMTAPIVSQMTFSEAVGFAAQSTMSDFLAGMFAFSWAGVVMIAVMVIVMVIQILMQCDEASTETAAKINLKLCIPVGNYCATKILFGCWSTAHAHCCYSNKLSRIIEEQAHSASQLNLPWGDPKDPQTCAGLTIPQLQAIDWDRMDWSEYIDDLQHRITAPTADSVTAQAPGIIGQTDYPGQAAATINKYGSLGDRVTASITVPGKDTVPDRSHPATVVLYVAVNGIGTINVSPGDQHCQGGTCKLTVPANTPLTLTATPAALTTFSGWSGDCTGGGICTLTLRDSASVAAQFATSGYSVTTAADGNGTGTITSSPAGITCPSTCATAFPPNTRVTLTASAGVNSTFTGWGGVCANQGTVCTFTATRSVTIRAAFLQLPQIVTFGPQTPGTVKVGVPTTWTVGVSGGIPPVEVQFIRDDNGMAVTAQDFAPGTTYTWTPTAADLAGNPHRIQAAVRNAGSTSPGDDYAITDYFTVVP